MRETLVDVVEPIVYDEALELIREHRRGAQGVHRVGVARGDRGAAGPYLGVDEAIATRAELDAEGRYTGRTELYCYGPDKVVAIAEVAERDGIDLAASTATATRPPTCRCSRPWAPVAVNPDRELLRERERLGGAPVHPAVPLRERVPMPAPRTRPGRRAVLAAVAVGGRPAGCGTGDGPRPARRAGGAP